MAETTDRELLIRLEEKVDMILERIRVIPILEERIRCVEKEVYGISNIKKDITDLEKKSEQWSILNSVGIAFIGIITLLVNILGG